VKAIVVNEPGGPEVLQYQDVPDPAIGPGDVLIRVQSVGVNFADHLMRIGAYLRSDPPVIPGLEAAGMVEAVGAEVQGLTVGQPVLALARYTYAERVVAPAWAVLPAPTGIGVEEAGAIPVAFTTAWHALVTCARLQAGESVLVHAAGSGVGSAAIQVARELGGSVIATAGQGWKLERARELGAAGTINYDTQDVAAEIMEITGGQGVDVVLEGVGKTTFPASLKSLRASGRMVVYGAPSGPRVELDTRLAIFRNLTIYGMAVTTSPRFPETVADFVRNALPWFAEGRLRPVVDRSYALTNAGEAHQRMMDRAQFGKLVLIP
jgi:NADPH:quinone reductase-like Zn-dependent oxidoreductase